MPAILQLLVALSFFATGAFYRVLGFRFGLHKSTLWRIVRAVRNAVALRRAQFNSFPRPNTEQIRSVTRAFYAKCGMGNVVGATDCAHVRILRTRDKSSDFLNRKGYYPVSGAIHFLFRLC